MLEKGATIPSQDPLNKGFYSRIHMHVFLIPKKGRPIKTSCESVSPQSASPVSAIQNGGHPCGEVSPSTRGLDEHNTV